MGASVLYTAPCGCQAVEEHAGGVTWGVRRCESHPGDELAPEIAEYFGLDGQAHRALPWGA